MFLSGPPRVRPALQQGVGARRSQRTGQVQGPIVARIRVDREAQVTCGCGSVDKGPSVLPQPHGIAVFIQAALDEAQPVIDIVRWRARRFVCCRVE